MKTEAHFLPPSIRLFFRCFIICFPFFYLAQFFVNVVFYNPKAFFSLEIFTRSLLFALAVSAIPMLASRRMKLIVSFLHHREPLQNWLIHYFDKRGWQMKSNNELTIEFNSKNKINKLLNLDRTSVLFAHHEIVITGPYRVIDDVYSRLSFGQQDFE